MVAGITSASIGTLLSSSVFILSNNYFLNKTFHKFKISQSGSLIDCKDWKKRFFISYILSDIAKILTFIPFEARKQRIQLGQYKYNDSLFFKNIFNSVLPLIIRDSLSRFITLSLFINLLHAQHNPQLTITLNEMQFKIKELYKYLEENNRIDEFAVKEQQLISNHFDYSNFKLTSSNNKKFFCLLFSVFMSTLITQPLDVISTKYLTQTDKTYNGNIYKCVKYIIEYESYKKFYSGFMPRLVFNVFSAQNILVFYSMIYYNMFNYFHDN